MPSVGWPLALAAAIVLAGAAVAAPAEKLTICHHPSAEARTLQVSSSAWEAHRRHGDHEGPCRGASPSTGAPATLAHVYAAVHKADGDVDGSARFVFGVHNDVATARDVRLDGLVEGDGRWRVATDGCSLQEDRLACQWDRLPPGSAILVDIRLHDGLEACSDPRVAVKVGAANDDATRDDEASARTWVGACALWRE